jgi:hypothetical protein
MAEYEHRVGGPEHNIVPHPAVDATEVHHEAPAASANGTEDQDWHAEAGRKGAHRIHQLIEAGRRYEAEHGLKSGRQRLRQLIELGKIYEQEHGLRPAARKARGKRLSRMEREETLATLLDCLIRIAKPSFRPELQRLADVLHVKDNGRAA